MKTKKYQLLGLFFAFGIVAIYLVSLASLLIGNHTLSYSGFAVDSKGYLYIGFDSGKIKVFDGQQPIKTLSAQTSRGYEFTILEGDILYVVCGDRAYNLDLDGHVLKRFDSNYERLYKFRPKDSEFVCENGITYKMHWNFGRTKITKTENDNKTTAYIMPLTDYCIKIILIVGTVAWVTVVLKLIIYTRGKQGNVLS